MQRGQAPVAEPVGTAARLAPASELQRMYAGSSGLQPFLLTLQVWKGLGNTSRAVCCDHHRICTRGSSGCASALRNSLTVVKLTGRVAKPEQELAAAGEVEVADMLV